MPLTEVARFVVSHLQVTDEQGKVDESLDPKCSDEDLVQLYRGMSLSREADQRMLKLQRQGRMGTFPLCTGQEAVACGAAFAMGEKDWLVGSYRELGARLMRGESLVRYMRYWNGYEEGNVQPHKGRSLPVAAVVGSHPLHAVGVAYAMQYRGERDSAVVTFFGDGATSEGDVHEAMNFAGVWKAPVVFVCANNQWAISTARDQQTASETIAQKAFGYGFEGVQVDGNDVLAVYSATRAALHRARGGGGPSLIEALTYRLLMHTTADDPKRYRSDSEVEAWWQRDPLRRLRLHMVRRGIWDDARESALKAESRQLIEEAVRQVEADREVRPDAPFDHVLGTPHAELERQRERFLADLDRRGDADG